MSFNRRHRGASFGLHGWRIPGTSSKLKLNRYFQLYSQKNVKILKKFPVDYKITEIEATDQD